MTGGSTSSQFLYDIKEGSATRVEDERKKKVNGLMRGKLVAQSPRTEHSFASVMPRIFPRNLKKSRRAGTEEEKNHNNKSSVFPEQKEKAALNAFLPARLYQAFKKPGLMARPDSGFLYTGLSERPRVWQGCD